ncbi:carboxylesterase family protein [Novosphingobium sp.]|uniref:carboxylesterase/lipase family protein n=1 Tax=Novosphingobium sp. TaxID=1874826 RepID=UPI00334089A5
MNGRYGWAPVGGLIMALATLAGVSAPLCAKAPKPAISEHAAPPLITVGDARVTGVALPGGVDAYLGIRYGVAPVGERRWHVSTQAPLHGAVNATHFGATCPQSQGTAAWYRKLAVAMGSDGDVVPATPPGDEDCLFLNIWTPARAKGTPAKPLPVMVWVHGGSNTGGYGHEANYRGARLAARGVVVVTINYRLGALGFFAHPAVPDVSAGRQGLSDQITALRWVRDHVAAFGGDAARVTLFGESAGGTDIVGLMHMPVAKGLFARAIVESGYLSAEAFATPAAATRAATDLFARDVPPADLAKQTPDDLVHLQAARHPGQFVSPLVPAAQAFRVPLLIGSNADEYRMYLPADPATRGAAEAHTLAGLAHAGDAAHLLQRLSNDAATRADLLASAPEFHCPAVALAGDARTAGLDAWVYRFDRVRPGHHGFGAYHGAEIPYVFGTSDAWLPADAADRALSDTIMRYWVNFARTGNPNAPGLPAWPRWVAAGEATATPVLHFGTTVHAAPLPDLALCPLIGEPHS